MLLYLKEIAKTFLTGEGCSKTNSYINKLQKNYWADIWEKFKTAGEDQEKLQKFYTEHKNRFVTNYAATNPGEDFAEVFATFVTRKGGVNGNSIAEKKIQMMYDSAELLAFRDFTRSTMTSAKSRSYLPTAGTWKRSNTIGNPNKGCTHRRK